MKIWYGLVRVARNRWDKARSSKDSRDSFKNCTHGYSAALKSLIV